MSWADTHRAVGRLGGACRCGACAIHIDGPHVAAVSACHCSMCQRWNGALFTCFTADPKGVTVDGPVTIYASSDFAERAFCATCGSHLWIRNTQPEDDYEFMPGLFPNAAAFPLASEIYCDRAPAYTPLNGAHIRATRAEYETKNLFVEGDKP